MAAGSAPPGSRKQTTGSGVSREDLFTVVLDHFVTDTARYADILLPSTMQPEHKDLHIAYGHLYVAWNEPAVAPPGECMPASEVFRRIAGRMGLTEPCLYDTDEEMARQVLASGDPSLAGITLERLKQDGWARLNYPADFIPFAAGFPTPSGKLEFHSERMARDGLDPLAGYAPPYEAAQRETPLARRYPLSLVATARHYGLNSIFSNSPRHARRQGPSVVRINPVDASARLLGNGVEVRIFNDRGEFRAIAEVTDSVRLGVVATTKGAWPSLERGGCHGERDGR